GSFTLGTSQAWAAAVVTFKATNGAAVVAQETVTLPLFWLASAPVNSSAKWVLLTGATPIGTTGSVIGAQLVCTADGATDDAAFTPPTTSTLAPGTSPNIPTSTSLNGLTATGCNAGNALHYQLSRQRYNASDNYEGYIGVIGTTLQVGITQ